MGVHYVSCSLELIKEVSFNKDSSSSSYGELVSAQFLQYGDLTDTDIEYKNVSLWLVYAPTDSAENYIEKKVGVFTDEDLVLDDEYSNSVDTTDYALDNVFNHDTGALASTLSLEGFLASKTDDDDNEINPFYDKTVDHIRLEARYYLLEDTEERGIDVSKLKSDLSLQERTWAYLYGATYFD